MGCRPFRRPGPQEPPLNDEAYAAMVEDEQEPGLGVSCGCRILIGPEA